MDQKMTLPSKSSTGAPVLCGGITVYTDNVGKRYKAKIGTGGKSTLQVSFVKTDQAVAWSEIWAKARAAKR